MIGVAVVAAASLVDVAVRVTAVAEIAAAAKPPAAAALGAAMAVVAAAMATEAAWKMVNGVAVSQAMCTVKFLWLPVMQPMSPRTPVATSTGQTEFDLRSRSDVC